MAHTRGGDDRVGPCHTTFATRGVTTATTLSVLGSKRCQISLFFQFCLPDLDLLLTAFINDEADDQANSCQRAYDDSDDGADTKARGAKAARDGFRFFCRVLFWCIRVHPR